jgi:hypothetical protein
MSTDFGISEKVRLSDLLDGRLERFGVYEHMTEVTSDQQKCLTDGDNHLWVFANDEGFVSILTRNAGGGSPDGILSAIAEGFRTEIFSEHEPQYWGFDTQDQWDAWQQAIAKQNEDKFYAEVLKFVAGEPNGIRPGTVGEGRALIAKRLIAGDPGLGAPERRRELMEAILDDCDLTEYVSLSSPF